VTALASLVAVSDSTDPNVGASVWWKLKGEVTVVALADALTALGLASHAPEGLSPEVALTRAVATLRGPGRRVRKLRQAGAWLVTDEVEDVAREDLDYSKRLTVRLDAIGRVKVQGGSWQEEADVVAAYEHHQGHLDTQDISGWLIEQATRIGAVGLREGGGIYFVPAPAMYEWRLFGEALKACAPDSTVYALPTMRGDEALRAVVDSLATEVEAEVAKVGGQVISGALGVRGLNNRAQEARGMADKVRRYESLLGTNLTKLVEAVEKLDMQIVAATLAAEAQAEEDANG